MKGSSAGGSRVLIILPNSAWYASLPTCVGKYWSRDDCKMMRPGIAQPSVFFCIGRSSELPVIEEVLVS